MSGVITRRGALGMMAGLVAAGTCRSTARAVEIARFGSRIVHSVSDGGFSLPQSMLARGVPPEDVRALLQSEGLPVEGASSVLNVTLIQDGAGWTIIDCGAGGNFLAGSGKLAANLEAAGIAKEAVKHVLFTHAHPDHLWGTIDEFDSDLFPNARYAISEAEWSYWSAPDVYSKLPEDRHAFAAGAQRIFKAIAEKTTRFKPGQELVPGIIAVDTAGHTPGHVSFVVSGNGGSLMVLGDALTHRAVSFRRPDWPSGADSDAVQGAATRRKLLDQLVADKLPFIGYHLPTPGLGRAEKDGTAYRFVAGA